MFGIARRAALASPLAFSSLADSARSGRSPLPFSPLPRLRRRRSPAPGPPLFGGGLGSPRPRRPGPRTRLRRLVLVAGLLVLLRLEQIGGVEERALFLADVDEGRLDARQNGFDPAEIDVADGAPVVGTVDQQLDQAVVLEDRHAGFPLASVDQNFALQAVSPGRGGLRRRHGRGRSRRRSTSSVRSADVGPQKP